jgi:hypothetical protein
VQFELPGTGFKPTQVPPVIEKSVALVPPMAPGVVMLIGEVVRLVRVIVFGALVVPSGSAANVVVAGKSVTPMPVPDSDTICGLEPSESLMSRVPVRAPFCVGLNSTLMVQEAREGMLPVQVLADTKKSPETVTVPITSALVFDLLVTFTAFAALVLPTNAAAKLRGFGATATAVPAPSG